ncbi:hypothetical protein HDU76_002776 [Blyttiomyces sp. JEL0837]|nr:hypothetical protein HDU76_002776 [Blyttiomyces sp. JEL0837]
MGANDGATTAILATELTPHEETGPQNPNNINNSISVTVTDDASPNATKVKFSSQADLPSITKPAIAPTWLRRSLAFSISIIPPLILACIGFALLIWLVRFLFMLHCLDQDVPTSSPGHTAGDTSLPFIHGASAVKTQYFGFAAYLGFRSIGPLIFSHNHFFLHPIIDVVIFAALPSLVGVILTWTSHEPENKSAPANAPSQASLEVKNSQNDATVKIPEEASTKTQAKRDWRGAFGAYERTRTYDHLASSKVDAMRALASKIMFQISYEAFFGMPSKLVTFRAGSLITFLLSLIAASVIDFVKRIMIARWIHKRLSKVEAGGVPESNVVTGSEVISPVIVSVTVPDVDDHVPDSPRDHRRPSAVLGFESHRQEKDQPGLTTGAATTAGTAQTENQDQESNSNIEINRKGSITNSASISFGALPVPADGNLSEQHDNRRVHPEGLIDKVKQANKSMLTLALGSDVADNTLIEESEEEYDDEDIAWREKEPSFHVISRQTSHRRSLRKEELQAGRGFRLDSLGHEVDSLAHQIFDSLRSIPLALSSRRSSWWPSVKDKEKEREKDAGIPEFTFQEEDLVDDESEEAQESSHTGLGETKEFASKRSTVSTIQIGETKEFVSKYSTQSSYGNYESRPSILRKDSERKEDRKAGMVKEDYKEESKGNEKDKEVVIDVGVGITNRKPSEWRMKVNPVGNLEVENRDAGPYRSSSARRKSSLSPKINNFESSPSVRRVRAVSQTSTSSDKSSATTNPLQVNRRSSLSQEPADNVAILPRASTMAPNRTPRASMPRRSSSFKVAPIKPANSVPITDSNTIHTTLSPSIPSALTVTDRSRSPSSLQSGRLPSDRSLFESLDIIELDSRKFSMLSTRSNTMYAKFKNSMILGPSQPGQSFIQEMNEGLVRYDSLQKQAVTSFIVKRESTLPVSRK